MISDDHQLKAVPIHRVTIENGFWAERQKTNREQTLPAVYHQMKITGRIDAWKLDWHEGKTKPHIFWDSDAGKWIESVGYSLMTHPDAEMEKQVDEVVDLIEKAQHPDGYLNIFFTSVEPENKLKNLRDWHEFYDAGHLAEAAVAYYQATGKRKLLDVICRYIDFIDARYGAEEGKTRGYDGHPEVELALMKLYEETGEERYFKLSQFFIEERGQQPHFYDIEAQARGEKPEDFWAKDYRYCQAHLPVREQTSAVGHSVRAAYLYAGVADLARMTDDKELLEVSRTIWDDLTQHQMYITGGLGPTNTNEGFTFAYDLPNETAYAETCAAISLVFWAFRMFHIDPDSRYTDVMERALYNGVLSGVSYEGRHFFYANPLASYPQVNPYEHWSGITSEEHYRRSEWFTCACCPPNLTRLVASINNYFYSTSANSLYVHLYNSSRAELQVGEQVVKIEQATNYPWDGDVRLSVTLDAPANFTLALRIPDWCGAHEISVNGETVSADVVRGYAQLSRTWASGDVVELKLAMPVERVMPHPKIRQNAGQVALQRGPVVYCLEEVDNGADLANVVLPVDGKLNVELDADLFGGISVITGDALRVEPEMKTSGLYQFASQSQLKKAPFTFKAIPYCFWANREPGEMRVWVRDA